jgi:hypothetical protein
MPALQEHARLIDHASSERVRLQAIRETYDRLLGRPAERQDVERSGEVTITVRSAFQVEAPDSGQQDEDETDTDAPQLMPPRNVSRPTDYANERRASSRRCSLTVNARTKRSESVTSGLLPERATSPWGLDGAGTSENPMKGRGSLAPRIARKPC